MLGLDNAGKTTILYKLKLNEVVSTIPTIGFNVETVRHNGLEFTVWDVRAQQKFRAHWRYHFQNAYGMFIFSMTPNDRERYKMAREE
ncbi:uncharacterized protein LOC134709620 [Mytilus trossulus]|uniref:uncharacterized protein LOC134709620 n=1 Tax=Mytilus trossulus TaxID=6551 RepID=UPI003006C0B5